MSLPQTAGEFLLVSNSSCSKSRATQALLEARGVAFTERRYLEQPLTLDELRELGRRLELAPADWIRSREAPYAELGLGPDSSEDELLAAIAAHPVLLERPILVDHARARVGRPPEKVLELFE